MNSEIPISMGKLQNKVAAITGAADGIGRETALLFAKEGARVIVLDINDVQGNRTVEMIKENRNEGMFIKMDVTKALEVEKAVKMIVSTYGRLDILVNNTGVFMEGDVVETSESDWNRIININLTGFFLCMKYCIPEMLKNGGGSIVNVASEAGVVGIAGQVAYNVSKAGVIALTKSTAVDYALRNIRINCISPGRCLTPLVQKIIDDSENPEETMKILSEDRPLRRIGSPREIANGILFLASDDALYAIGTVLSIDGGYTVQ